MKTLISNLSYNQKLIIQKIINERARQDFLWGNSEVQSLDRWIVLLLEEIGEVARAHIENDSDNLEEELIQVASLSIKILEKIYNNEIKESEVNEDYILYYIEKFANDYADASIILEQEDIAALILTEDRYTLSPQIYDRLYETKLQYYKNDLAVIDWNSAFIIEPSGSLDIPDVIEFALNQLLEVRYYDDLLDKKLSEIYSAIELKDMSIFSSRYTDLALEAGQRYIEIAEIVESVENSLKVIGDLYHSVVFRMASKKFRFSDWQSSIDKKLENLAEICKRDQCYGYEYD